MVISDMNIICIDQMNAITVNFFNVGIEVVENHNGYGSHWDKLNKCQGIWYQIYPIDSNTLQRHYKDEFFDCLFSENGNYALVNSKYFETIEAIINAYIVLSPAEELLLLLRLDEQEESENETVLRLVEFIARLHEARIQFNKIYRIIK